MKLKELAAIVLIMAGIVVNTYPRYYIHNGDVFCTWVAGSFVLISLAIPLLSSSIWVSLVAELTVVLAINDFLDEYHRIAEKPSRCEYAIVGVLILITLFRFYKRWTNNKKQHYYQRY